MDSVYTWIRKSHRRNLVLGLYPGSLTSAILFTTLVNTLFVFGVDLTFGLSTFFQRLLSHRTRFSYLASQYLAGLVIWTLICLGRNFLLKNLFAYRGWMYEGPKPSIKTKLVIFSIKVLTCFSNPVSKTLYGLQGALPALPVPTVEQSVKRYLESVRPLVDDEKHANLTKLAEEFQTGISSKLQRYLLFKSWLAPNYVSDWWEDYVYLVGRPPILINSNYYGLDVINHPTANQAARAAQLAFEALSFRQSIVDNTLEPLVGQGVIPLCSWQYERFFNTCRIPGETIDVIQHIEDSDHIIVHRRGKYYEVAIRHPGGTYRRGRQLNLPELQSQFLHILSNDEASRPAPGEEKLAALTGWDRTNWARTRGKFFSSGINKESLDLIEKAAFIVILDEEDYSVDLIGTENEHFDHFARSLFHGKGHDRWLDKTFNIIVGKNGRAGLNNEHTWADAPVMGFFWEVALTNIHKFTDYDENGLISLPIVDTPPTPKRLKWDFPKDCLEAIDTASRSTRGLIDDLDLKILSFNHFGKGLMKKCRTSPDAFIQMALQLAYYRNRGRFDLTYEASMTRLYKQGRTETVRPCSMESCEWVRSMDTDLPREEKIKLFKKACELHVSNYRDAMCGKGCDRHLFGLYVVAKYLKVDSPFLREALSEPWRLSTSQTPACSKNVNKDDPKGLISPGGGFGPVTKDGYGVSYIIAGEKLIFFHVSSFNSCPSTDSTKFAREIERSLTAIRDMFSIESQNVDTTTTTVTSNGLYSKKKL